jgi:5-methyltetrahydropteroyltriglutamate--homocysteine methyltransferase
MVKPVAGYRPLAYFSPEAVQTTGPVAHLFERVKVPEGKVLCPGVITHASNIVEHPELIAERLVRFANLVGRENVMAGADCGFSSQALYKTEVHPTVVWEKFKAMRHGADLATKQLWK